MPHNVKIGQLVRRGDVVRTHIDYHNYKTTNMLHRPHNIQIGHSENTRSHKC